MEATQLLGCYTLKFLEAYVENVNLRSAEPLGENGGPSIGKCRERDVKS
jgi:hypothetical protein